MKPHNIEICFLEDFSSLEKALISVIGCSKSQIKKYLSKDQKKYKVDGRSVVKIPINLVNIKMISPVYEGEKVDIIFEDENLLAINKPPKIHSHPLSYCENNNVLSFLRSQNLIKDQVNTENYDRGLLNRLDYETSGLLIYIKNESLYFQLRQNFKGMVKKKIYRAWVHGKLDESNELVDYLESFSRQGHKMRVTSTKNSMEATLKFKPLRHENLKTLIEVELMTGHRHQIRCQLAHYGYPIVGDQLYGSDNYERLFLHSFQYEVQLREKLYTLKCELPEFM